MIYNDTLVPMFKFFGKKENDETLFFHTDIHSHILPGIDDGARSVDRSVDLVKRMMGWGLNRLIVTPHVTEDTFENTPETVAKAFTILHSALDAEGIEIDISNSAEYRIDDFFMRQVEGATIMPYPNNYLLVENSFVQEPWDLDQILFKLQMKGFKLILAHPERYRYYHTKRDRYRRIHDSGTLFQINVLSLAGYYGKEEKKMAESLIEAGMVDLVGTDLHHSSHADCIDRYIGSKDFHRHRDDLAGKILNDIIFK